MKVGEYKDITWRELPGNKFVVALKSEMLTENGYKASQKIKQAYRQPFMAWVHYDRDYVVAWLASKVIQKLSSQGKLELVDLFDEAWNLYFAKQAQTSEDK